MKYTFLLIFLVVPIIATAQRADRKKFEFEVGLNHTFAAASRGADVNYRLGGYFEGRFNIRRLPVDLGFQVSYSNVRRTRSYVVDYNIVSFLAVSDYAFRPGKKINPYIGLGAGWVSNLNAFVNYESGSEREDVESPLYFICVPRGGVKFFNRLNLSFDYAITNKNLTRAHLRLGYYF